MKEIKTEVVIASSPENVWNVLTKLDEWRDWNATVSDVSGELKLGSKLQVTMKGMGGQPETVLTPVLTSLENQKIFAWKMSMAGGLLFRYEKVLELEPVAEGTKLLHKEIYGGLFPTLMWKKFEKFILPSLNLMNKGLKKNLEK